MFCLLQESVPLVCAHGGDSTYTTPNTKKAFAAALRERVACVEMDVAAAKDGDLFVLHKRELLGILMQLEENNNNNGSHKEEWWSGRPAKVEEFSAREIARMRTADGQKVLPAKDVLQVLLKDNHLKHIILDVKTHKIKEQGGGEGKGIEDENVREMVDGVKQLVRETPGCMEKCVVWAKSDAVIKAMGAELPGVRLGMTVMNETQESRDLGLDRLSRLDDAKAPPAWVAMHWEMVSEEIVARAQTLGKRVFGWTANTDDITSHILKHAAVGDGNETKRNVLFNCSYQYSTANTPPQLNGFWKTSNLCISSSSSSSSSCLFLVWCFVWNRHCIESNRMAL